MGGGSLAVIGQANQCQTSGFGFRVAEWQVENPSPMRLGLTLTNTNSSLLIEQFGRDVYGKEG